MNSPLKTLRVLRVLAHATLWLLLATVVLSAFMRLSLAGLDCGDWPACYGAPLRTAAAPVDAGVPAVAQPPAVIAARLAHRVVATLALLAIVSMVMLAWAARPRPTPVAALAGVLLALALALAVLGVATPGARLPAVGVGNLLGGFAALAVAWRLVGQLAPATPASLPRGPRLLVWTALTLLAVQLASGALLSTSFAALSCHSLEECHDLVSAAGWPWEMLSPWREPVFSAAEPHVNVDGAMVQWLHRVGAIVVAVSLIALAIVAVRVGRAASGVALLVLIGLQLVLALLALSGGLPLPAAMLHNLGAVALLAVLVRLL